MPGDIGTYLTDSAGGNSGGRQPVPPQPYGNGLSAPQATGMNIDQSQPGMGENYAGAALGYYGANGMPGRSAQAYNQFQSSNPGDIGAYYNNAVNQTNNTLNQQMAARGMYGSSAALGQLSNADTNLYAQQAKDQANYNLQRGQLAGQLAGSADQNELAWTSGLGNLAFQGQNAGMQRGQNIFADQMAMSGQLAGMEGNAYDQMFGADQQNLDNTFGALGVSTGNNLSQAQGAYNQQQGQNQQSQKAIDDFEQKLLMMGLGAAV